MPDFDNFKLYELRSLARELGIPVDAVRKHGDLRLRQTWISAIEVAITLIQGESATSGHFDQKLETAIAPSDEDSTCGQNVHKFTVIQNEFGFIPGQLIPHGIPASIATNVEDLVKTQRWAKAFELLQNYPRGYRILSRIQEMVA
ncbi:MAG TPA: hypothetical protein V6D12_21480 [Candidatus Obscuribacterales bacterium]